MRSVTRTLLLLALAAAAGGSTAAGCGGSKSNGPTTTQSAGGNGGAMGSSGTTMSGSSGTGGSMTSSGFGGGGTNCVQVGAACMTASDCCSGTCTGGVCNLPACTADDMACSSNAECCSGDCANNECAPLSTSCKTLNNPCTTSAQCCSGLCLSGQCSASSWCTQTGDVCATGAQCCGGICTKSSPGALYGTCSSPPSGSANCNLTDGMLCGGSTADGGVATVDGGLPACGGACCSRLCAPYGPTGTLICQPASGCHVVGDLCTKDTDCCGAAGLPGGSGNPVTCDISPPYVVGVCRNPMGCKPDGDICRLSTMSCNASCDCCSGNCQTQDTCKQDTLGVPRCAAAMCAKAGEACASSANCCNDLPCVPNPVDGGTPPYVCGDACVPKCGKCTVDADCCVGASCQKAPGSAEGVCGPCLPPPPDAGPDSGSSTSSSGGSDAGVCALYGQSCTMSSQCCNGVPCTNATGMACTTQTGCTCHFATN